MPLRLEGWHSTFEGLGVVEDLAAVNHFQVLRPCDRVLPCAPTMCVSTAHVRTYYFVTRSSTTGGCVN